MSESKAADSPTAPRRADYRPAGVDRKTGFFATLKRAVTEFSEDNLTDWAAALTYWLFRHPGDANALGLGPRTDACMGCRSPRSRTRLCIVVSLHEISDSVHPPLWPVRSIKLRFE